MKKRLVGMVVLLVSVFALAACQQVTPQEAESTFCTDLAAVRTAAEQVKAINADTTVDDAKAAVSGLEEAMKAAAESAKEVKESQWDAINGAFETMQKDINDISSSDTIGEAAQAVAESYATFEQAVNTSLDVNCRDVMTPTASN